MLAALIALTAFAATADARCRQPGSYPGTVSAHSMQKRSFYLYPQRATIATLTTSVKDKLSFVVKRGNKIICRSGRPAALSDCELNHIGSAGVRYVYVKNTNNRDIDYNLECRD
jgi:hypothetical protein